jgi:hypothetical protein
MVTMNQRGPATAGQWTVEKQASVVLRLLQGESIDGVSAETGVSVRELDSWRAVFLTAAVSALRKYRREVEKQAVDERRRKEAEPAHSEFTTVPEPSPSAVKLPVPEHLHYLWVTLGLDDE